MWAFLVPLTFDAAAFYAAALSLRAVLSADSALADRLLVWAYAVGSAALNVWHADRSGGRAAALFYGVASLSAVVLWDRTLRALRRDALRDLGAVDPPAPRFRFARWAIKPRETWRAWSLAITEGVSLPAEALARAREIDRQSAGEAAGEMAAQSTNAAIEGDNHAEIEGRRQHVSRVSVHRGGGAVDRSRSGAGVGLRGSADGSHAADAHRSDGFPVSHDQSGVAAAGLAGVSQAAAVRIASAELGGDATGAQVVAWLAERGVSVKDHYPYDVWRRDRKKAAAAVPASLALVSGGEA
jgi:hypothetical protein